MEWTKLDAVAGLVTRF